MSTKIPQELTEAYETTISYMFHLIPISEMDIDSVIAEDTMMYGTTIDENIFGINDFKKVMKIQAAEMGGLDISYERNLVSQYYSNDGKTGIFVEEVKLIVNTGEAVSEDNIRISVVMEKTDGSWKLIHAHGSKPVESEKDPWHVKEWKAKKEKLEKKVAEQTADLQEKNLKLEIEAATERIRSRAMAMEKPDDIWNVLGVIKKEVEAFEMGNVSTWLFTFTEDGKVIHREMADYYLDGKVQDNFSVFDPNDYSASKQVVDRWGEDYFPLKFEGDSLLAFLDSVSEIDPEQTKSFRQAIESGHITEFWQVCSSFPKGIIGISFIETPPSKVQQVVVKITEAFGLAYKRYEDLQQAEKRRREAELEAAVERVRAHAMGMQEPDDIMNVLNVMKEEVDKFELGNIATWIWTKDEDGMITQWDISEVIEEGNLVNFNLRFDINKWPEINRHALEWEKGKKYYALNWRGEKLQDIVDEVGEVDPESGKMFQEAVDIGQIEDYWHVAAPFSKGNVGLDFTSAPPEITESILLKMSSAFDMAYQRFEDLQEAEQRRKEAELEATVERVRAHAMGMQTTEDLSNVLQVLNHELSKLDLKGQNSAYIWLYNEEGNVDGINLDLRETEADFKIYSNTFDPQKFKHFFKPIADDLEKNPEYSVTYTGPEDIRGHIEEMVNSDNEAFKQYAVMAQKAVDSGVLTENWSASSGFGIGLLGCDFQKEPTGWAEKVIPKMASAFGMAYQRFKDLQRAEAQTREAQINLAVERVRARALAMFESTEILEVVKKLRDEIMGLNIPNVSAATIHLREQDGKYRVWDLTSVEDDGNGIDISLDICYRLEDTHPDFFMREVCTRTEDYFVVIQGLSRTKHTIDWLRKNGHPDYANEFAEFLKESGLERAYHPTVPLQNGRMSVDLLDEPTPEIKIILKKMAGAFDLAYKRFEDLQRAEAQAREAEVDASLERVRAKGMAMHSTDDIESATAVVFNELSRLGIQMERCGITLINETPIFEIWSTPLSQENGKVVNIVTGFLDSRTHPILIRSHQDWVEKEDFSMYKLIGDEVREYYTQLENQPEYQFPKIAVYPDQQILQTFYFSEGGIFVFTKNELSEEAKNIFKRFTKVFAQTYTRFLDLQKAEKQAYESKVEASLERVRGMAAAMNHSDDLMQIAEAMFKELEILKINPLRYGLGMIDGEKKEAELWASTVNDGHYLDMLGTITLTWHPMLRKVLDAWDAQYEEMIYELKGEERSDYYRKIGRINPDIPNLKALQDPEKDMTEFVSFFPFKAGALYAFTTGEPNADGRSILKRFANVFEQAHIRYNDLQTAEKQARQIREERDRLADTLKELRAAQDQLVQQEKLASLGQLTAGIAHEIKNPLNFVNNFSDLSMELVEEVREEVKRQKAKVKSEKEPPFEGRGERSELRDVPNSEAETGPQTANTPLNPSSHRDTYVASDDSIATNLILDILDDIETNLKTIHKHGTRADGIVKSMLQHSRGGDGKPESTSLNPLIKEYVNLAFHGMRAGKEPINVDMVFKLDEEIGEVPLIAEDFSRVILNLVNNAFDAMQGAGHKVQGTGGYEPKLTVRTHKKDSAITIEIEDNGPGIPIEMKDKILQPFFTTKKGTAGTGLGLSITNDIVKAHGGTIDIKTEAGNGSVFIISLPSV